ncbi:hypothetical protein [Prosthecobacter sp.]|uniref:hypothetical protein n=1 Tax=Prosthecobacter sp. TaxID=1965333 RepID=UPI001E067DDC|nr:hypothetical protein [Prosthecobacter sp.]MCB1277025.1 hypothetical protein [Prosthecobacter sp.]
MRHIFFCLIAWMGFLPSWGHARLDDTERRCVERYGSAERPKQRVIMPEPLVSGATESTYHFQGWALRVAFLDGKVVAQEYQKELPHPSGKTIKAEELQAILEAEQSGGAWERSATHPLKADKPEMIIGTALLGGMHWKRSDGAGATLTPMAYTIVFYSREGIQAALRAEAAKEQKRRKSMPKF